MTTEGVDRRPEIAVIHGITTLIRIPHSHLYAIHTLIHKVLNDNFECYYNTNENIFSPCVTNSMLPYGLTHVRPSGVTHIKATDYLENNLNRIPSGTLFFSIV